MALKIWSTQAPLATTNIFRVSKTDNEKLPQLRLKTLRDVLAGAERTITEY